MKFQFNNSRMVGTGSLKLDKLIKLGIYFKLGKNKKGVLTTFTLEAEGKRVFVHKLNPCPASDITIFDDLALIYTNKYLDSYNIKFIRE